MFAVTHSADSKFSGRRPLQQPLLGGAPLPNDCACAIAYPDLTPDPDFALHV